MYGEGPLYNLENPSLFVKHMLKYRSDSDTAKLYKEACRLRAVVWLEENRNAAEVVKSKLKYCRQQLGEACDREAALRSELAELKRKLRCLAGETTSRG